MPTRYFEDFTPGMCVDLGTVELSVDEIVEFARQFDPQSFHTDPVRAVDSVWGGLIASGWQTVGIYMRLYVEQILNSTISLGSPGVDKVRWLRPVRPGDRLHARYTVLETRASQSRPDRGIVRSRGEMLDDRGEVVMSLEAINFIGRRPG